jgi:caffeoyl-CoA O-methyltransferase
LSFLLPSAEQYVARFSNQEDPLLASLHEHTLAHHPEPHMLSGAIQATFLQWICEWIKPQFVLEIGTMVGYSTIALARGLPPGAQLHTIEKRKSDLDIARNFFKQAGIDQLIQIHEGDAKQILPQLSYPWDLVFLDADKTGYLDYYEILIPQMRPGALLIADNVLFHGAVLEENIKGKNAKALHAFNERVAQDDRIEKIMLTIRDGLFLIRKK